MAFFEQKEALVNCLSGCLSGGAEAANTKVQELLQGEDFCENKMDDLKPLVDHCLCHVVDSTLDEEGCPALHRALEITFSFAANGLVELPCPLNIVNDVLSSQTIEESSETFAYLESKKPFLIANGFFAEHKKRNAKVALLRLCNAMVKRLSKANDTVFCGRIQMFLATVFPVSDRSGVNLMGKFNEENITEYTEESEQTDLPEVDEGSVKASAPIDFNFYKKFWGLQKLFVSRQLNTDAVSCYAS
jgi:THO complex subunit 1